MGCLSSNISSMPDLVIRTYLYMLLLFSLQGLFERHKLVVATQLTMAILGKEGKLGASRFELLINRERRPTMPSPLPDWLPDAAWTAANALKARRPPLPYPTPYSFPARSSEDVALDWSFKIPICLK